MDIKKIRTMLCVDQKEFAEMLGVFHSTVSQWENGKTNISAGNLKKIKQLCESHNLDYYSFVD